MSSSAADVRHSLRMIDFPNCAMEALTRIENLVVNRSKQDYVMDLIAEFVFLEISKDKDIRKGFPQSSAGSMNLVQEFQLVLVLCDFFARPGPDATRNAVFLSLFGGTISPPRIRILVELISTSVSGLIAPLCCSAGAWIQQIGCTSAPSLELAHCLVKDFIIFSKRTSEQLKQLPMVAPRFAANFMTAVADLYLNDVKEQMSCPPDMLVELFCEWVTENSTLCLASQQPLALPSGAIAMPVTTPLAGLIRWCVLGPLFSQKMTYSKLHLAILLTINKIPPTSGPPTALNSQHLALIVSPLKNYGRKLVTDGKNPEQDATFQRCIDRFAQAVQVALAAKCTHGSTPQLLSIMETLPANKLLGIVIQANKVT